MKIDFVIGSLQSGGAERVVCNLANYFAEKNYDVRILTFRNGEKYSLNERIARKKFHKNFLFLNYTLLRSLFFLFVFYRKKQNRPDLINFHVGLMGLSCIPIAKLFNIPIIGSEHFNHYHSPKNIQRHFLWNFLYKKLNALTVLTNFDETFFQTKNRNVVVMPNPGSFEPIKQQNTNREPYVIAIGSLNRYYHKGFDNLLDIAKEVRKKHPNWLFKIVGEGEVGRTFLQEKIDQLDLNKNVKLLGYRSDVSDLLQKSSIFVLSSRYEGLPMALIEAASQGTACISYNCISGPSDIIKHNYNGILVKDQDKDQMLLGILNLIENPELRIELGEQAVASSVKFSITRIGLKWETLFHETISKIK